MNRAYSLLEIKAASGAEEGIIEGIATTPIADRVGDIIISEGAEFNLPLPLLWQHDSHSPIGEVLEAKVSKKNIKIKARIALGVTEKIDEYWKLIKAGLVKGLSIGFKALDTEPIPNSWSVTVKKWLWLELSTVTIAANGDATITSIKSLDRAALAASGKKSHVTARVIAAASGKTEPAKEEEDPMAKKTIAEQISAFEETRKQKQARLDEIMSASGEKGETLTAEQEEEYDTLEGEIGAIDKHLDRLRKHEKSNVASATNVSGVTGAHAASETRGGNPAGTIQVRANAPKLEPGIRLARYAKCLAISHKHHVNIFDVAQQFYKDDQDLVNTIKATVVAGSTVSGTWAVDLVGTETSAFADFVEYLRPRTIIGRFGTNGIPSLRRVPFRVALVSQTAAGAGYWVGQGKAKPLTNFDFDRTTLTPLKVANIAVSTEELLRDSSPSADAIIRDQLVEALRARMDTDFIDPGKAASAGVSPASILNGVAAIPSSGDDEDAVRADVKALMNAFIAANNAPSTGVWIMKETTALSLSLMTNTLGQSAFPGITMSGGSFAGMPVITSEYVGDDTDGAFVALVNASDIYFADEGGFELAISREASLEMSDAPTGSSVATVTAASLVSMFQTNSVAFRAERAVNWARRRASAVAHLSGVNWGAAGS